AAAQAAVPDRAELADRVAGLALRAGRAERHHRETLRREFRIAAGAIVDPRPLLQAKRYALADSTDSLVESAREKTRKGWERVSGLSVELRFYSPAAWVSRKRADAAVLISRATRGVGAARDASRGRLGVLNGKLFALDPTAVLSRGYAIATSRATGRAVRAVSEAAPGEALDVRVSDGTFGAVVERENAAGPAKRGT
ncbi:MAG: hypothetical protein M0Z38_12825, partial [Deltaproteobacteria bacterium]|nr:hypothetical protein [Deltaproteobacteria bacterium]